MSNSKSFLVLTQQDPSIREQQVYVDIETKKACLNDNLIIEGVKNTAQHQLPQSIISINPSTENSIQASRTVLSLQNQANVEAIRKDALIEKAVEVKPQDSVIAILPLVKSGYSLAPDFKDGWKPQAKEFSIPIPLRFGNQNQDYIKKLTKQSILQNADIDYIVQQVYGQSTEHQKGKVLYSGYRPKDSLQMHRDLLFNYKSDPLTRSSYPFKFPPSMSDDAQEWFEMANRKLEQGATQQKVINGGTSPEFLEQVNNGEHLEFDSKFECGNLDQVIVASLTEYDLYMRVDSNTKGHNQWFYFKVKSQKRRRVTFNVVNFTKKHSLFEQGMKICYCSIKEREKKLHQLNDLYQNGQLRRDPYNPVDWDMVGWAKGGIDIQYKRSKLNGILQQYRSELRRPNKEYFQLSFTFDFQHDSEDTVYFAYTFPYSFTKLHSLMQDLRLLPSVRTYVQEGLLCKALSGTDIPLLTVTSRAQSENFIKIEAKELLNDDPILQISPGLKQFVIVIGRVHSGECNSSFVMQGFLKYIVSQHPDAIELRKKFIFKVIPMINPDGVIIGNYRASMSGVDLNRQYLTPHQVLHQPVHAVKLLIKGLKEQYGDSCIHSVLDLHGHSKKKNIFIYGPHYQIHQENYLKMRIIPKLLSEVTPMFRYFSCKFRLQKSKMKTARIVLFKEFGIMNCFTVESSFHCYLSKKRKQEEFIPSKYEKMGRLLAGQIMQDQLIREQDAIDKERRNQERQRISKKRKLSKHAGKGKLKRNQVFSEDLAADLVLTPRKSARKNKKRQRNMRTIETVSENDGDTIQDEQVENPQIPEGDGTVTQKRGRTFVEIFGQIQQKENNKREEMAIDGISEDDNSSSSGSDSDPSGDEFEKEELEMIQKGILSTITNFQKAMQGKIPRVVKKTIIEQPQMESAEELKIEKKEVRLPKQQISELQSKTQKLLSNNKQESSCIKCYKSKEFAKCGQNKKDIIYEDNKLYRQESSNYFNSLERGIQHAQGSYYAYQGNNEIVFYNEGETQLERIQQLTMINVKLYNLIVEENNKDLQEDSRCEIRLPLEKELSQESIQLRRTIDDQRDSVIQSDYHTNFTNEFCQADSRLSRRFPNTAKSGFRKRISDSGSRHHFNHVINPSKPNDQTNRQLKDQLLLNDRIPHMNSIRESSQNFMIMKNNYLSQFEQTQPKPLLKDGSMTTKCQQSKNPLISFDLATLSAWKNKITTDLQRFASDQLEELSSRHVQQCQTEVKPKISETRWNVTVKALTTPNRARSRPTFSKQEDSTPTQVNIKSNFDFTSATSNVIQRASITPYSAIAAARPVVQSRLQTSHSHVAKRIRIANSNFESEKHGGVYISTLQTISGKSTLEFPRKTSQSIKPQGKLRQSFVQSVSGGDTSPIIILHRTRI